MGPGETAFETHSPVPNLYVILEGALHREAFLRHGKTPVPGNVLSRGALYGEAALQHAYLTKARVVSENGEREGVATRASRFPANVKRIVRARIHRARRLLANVRASSRRSAGAARIQGAVVERAVVWKRGEAARRSVRGARGSRR